VFNSASSAAEKRIGIVALVRVAAAAAAAASAADIKPTAGR